MTKLLTCLLTTLLIGANGIQNEHFIHNHASFSFIQRPTFKTTSQSLKRDHGSVGIEHFVNDDHHTQSRFPKIEPRSLYISPTMASLHESNHFGTETVNTWRLKPGELCERDEGTDFFYDMKVTQSGCMIECIFMTSSRKEWVGRYLDMTRTHRILIQDSAPCPDKRLISSHGCFNGFCQERSAAKVDPLPPEMSTLGTVTFEFFNGSHNMNNDPDGSLADPLIEIDIGSKIVSQSSPDRDTNHPYFNYTYTAKNISPTQEITIRMVDEGTHFNRAICFFKITPLKLITQRWNEVRRVYSVRDNCQIEGRFSWSNSFF